MADVWLYRYEVKGIQKFIMATDRLREMKGASALIVQLGYLFQKAREQAKLTDVEIVAPPAAGGATLAVPANQLPELERFMAGWPMIVARHAPGLQLVQAKVHGEDDHAIEALYAALVQARSRQPIELPEAGPLVMRAPRTGLPASQLGTEPGSESERLLAWDPGSERKRQASKKEDSLGDRIGKKYRWVIDLDQIGHRYVAVVHADGNDLGRMVKKIASEDRGEGLR